MLCNKIILLPLEALCEVGLYFLEKVSYYQLVAIVGLEQLQYRGNLILGAFQARPHRTRKQTPEELPQGVIRFQTALIPRLGYTEAERRKGMFGEGIRVLRERLAAFMKAPEAFFALGFNAASDCIDTIAIGESLGEPFYRMLDAAGENSINQARTALQSYTSSEDPAVAKKVDEASSDVGWVMANREGWDDLASPDRAFLPPDCNPFEAYAILLSMGLFEIGEIAGEKKLGGHVAIKQSGDQPIVGCYREGNPKIELHYWTTSCGLQQLTNGRS